MSLNFGKIGKKKSTNKLQYAKQEILIMLCKKTKFWA